MRGSGRLCTKPEGSAPLPDAGRVLLRGGSERLSSAGPFAHTRAASRLGCAVQLPGRLGEPEARSYLRRFSGLNTGIFQSSVKDSWVHTWLTPHWPGGTQLITCT